MRSPHQHVRSCRSAIPVREAVFFVATLPMWLLDFCDWVLIFVFLVFLWAKTRRREAAAMSRVFSAGPVCAGCVPCLWQSWYFIIVHQLLSFIYIYYKWRSSFSSFRPRSHSTWHPRTAALISWRCWIGVFSISHSLRSTSSTSSTSWRQRHRTPMRRFTTRFSVETRPT